MLRFELDCADGLSRREVAQLLLDSLLVDGALDVVGAVAVHRHTLLEVDGGDYTDPLAA